MTVRIPMADRIELWPLARIRRYDKNPRIHDDAQVRGIAASMVEFGFNAPIVVDQGTEEIIAGHGRLDAAEFLELPEAPVIPLAHLTPAQRRAYVIADNKLQEAGRWDTELLAAELEAIKDDGLDLTLVGFSDEALDAMLSGDMLGLADDNLRGEQAPQPAAGEHQAAGDDEQAEAEQEGGEPEDPPGDQQQPGDQEAGADAARSDRLIQHTTNLTADQLHQVERAIAAMKAAPHFLPGAWEDHDGAALAAICELYVTQHGGD